MRVGMYARKSVVFIGTGAGGDFNPYGTGFIGSTLDDDRFQFIVTASHVLDDIRRVKGNILIRANSVGGSATTFPVEWENCINCGDDIALISVSMKHDVLDFMSVELDRKYWLSKYEDMGEPDCGDEVCTIGLYTSHYGQTKNIPIVRIGHIAAMPDEPIRIRNGQHIKKGYLIEMRSIAGLSGSPVLLTVPTIRVRNQKIEAAKIPVHAPLGILLGHHVVESKSDEIIVPQYQDDGLDAAGSEPPQYDQRNTGFGVVAPIETAYDCLESEEMQKSMKNTVQEYDEKVGFVPDSTAKQEPSTKEDNPSHKEDFNRLLSAATRTPKSGG